MAYFTHTDSEINSLRVELAAARERADKAETDLAEVRKQHGDLIERLCALIPDDEGDDVAVEALIVAVVAAVREDEARQWSLTAGRAFRGGRKAAAQDIRAVREYPFSDAREHYARIAEGNTDHA
jgi:hypothetical protein